MDFDSFAIGFLVGIASGVIVGIILFEYESYRTRKQKEKSAREQWNTDLAYEVTGLCKIWELMKGCNTPSVELRKDLITQIREISVRSAWRHIKPSHRRAIKKSIRAFVKESRKLPDADDETWSNSVLQKVDAICADFLKIASDLQE